MFSACRIPSKSFIKYFIEKQNLKLNWHNEIIHYAVNNIDMFHTYIHMIMNTDSFVFIQHKQTINQSVGKQQLSWVCLLTLCMCSPPFVFSHRQLIFSFINHQGCHFAIHLLSYLCFIDLYFVMYLHSWRDTCFSFDCDSASWVE